VGIVHRDTAIELQGEYFWYSLDNKRQSSSSVAAAKKAIDKHFESKAAERQINLPVLEVLSDGSVIHSVIIGLDDNLRPIGLSAKYRSGLMVDTPDNEDLAAAYFATKKAYEDAQEKWRSATFSAHISDMDGRKNRLKVDAVQILVNRYNEAKKETPCT